MQVAKCNSRMNYIPYVCVAIVAPQHHAAHPANVSHSHHHHIPPHLPSLQSSDEKEKLQVQLKLLEEERRGLEKERNGYLEKIKDLQFQLQKVTEENMSQVEIAAQQRKLYESDFEKERAQREKLLAKYNTLQAEKETLVARLQQVSAL